MTAIIKSIHKLENKFNKKAECFMFHHPRLAFLAIFIGMPIFILSTVAVSAIFIVFPVAWFFGWL